jgi:hypothetical protein
MTNISLHIDSAARRTHCFLQSLYALEEKIVSIDIQEDCINDSMVWRSAMWRMLTRQRSTNNVSRTGNNLYTSPCPLRSYGDISNSLQQLLDMDRNILLASCCRQCQQLMRAQISQDYVYIGAQYFSNFKLVLGSHGVSSASPFDAMVYHESSFRDVSNLD